MSQYKRYTEERSDSKIIEDKHGFIKYRIVENGVYIEDIFIEKEFRKSQKASKLADEVCEIAKKSGYKIVFGSVCTDAKGSTTSIKVLLGYGMEVHSASNNMIYFKKSIGE